MGLIGYLNADAWKLLDVFGELLTHRPRGVEADQVEITGAFEEEDPQVDMQAGRENLRRGWLMIEDTVANVSTKSTWIVRGDEWTTSKIGTADVGWLKVWIERRDAGVRSAKPRMTI